MNAQSSGKIVPKVTITSRSITISEVFKMIRKQTGKVIWYRNEDVNENKKVNVNFKDASLEDVLKFLFQASDISWTYDDEAIILRKKKLSDNTSSSIVDTSLSPIQLITVTGKVTDEKGSPIIGATVVLKGNNQQGTTTNADGFFTLGAVKENASIVVSSVSFLTQEIPVRGRKSVGTVVMKEYVGVLDEVQIQAYGTTSRRIATTNISTIKADEITKTPVSNPLLVLQGRVPGIFIEQSTGLPGSGVKVRIQGQNSISKGNDPLYVIDGVPYSSQLLPSINGILGSSGDGGFNVTGSPLSFINPNDIESIDVLKDADATSIYGSRAANGVILITTKKGKSGNSKVTLSIQNGWGKVTRRLNLMNTNQYLQMRREAAQNDGIDLDAPSNNTDSRKSNRYVDLKFWDQNKYTDWQKVLTGGTAQYQNASISFSGGNQNTTFLLSANYHKETTVLPGNLNDQKGSIHFNLNNISQNNRFKVSFNGLILNDKNSLQLSDLTNLAITLAPNAPSLYNSDGSLNWAQYKQSNGTLISTWTNPLSYQLHKYDIKTNNLTANALLSYELINGLELKSGFGLTYLVSDEFATNPNSSYAPENRGFDYAKGSASYGTNNINSWTIEPQLTYQRIINKGKINVLIGTTFYELNRKRKAFNASGFSSDLQLEDINAAPVVTVDPNNGSIATNYKYNALFGRLNYNWLDRYIVNLTFRKDGSSRFGSENRFHNFWSVSGAWIFTEENLFSKMHFLSFGKLRASYGTSGNDQISDYAFLSLYDAVSYDRPYQGATGLRPKNIPNQYLEWEETKKLQIGIDLGFFDDRLLINTNYFHNRSSNQLLGYSLPSTAGFTEITSNLPATVQNSGWEIVLNSINFKRKNWGWSSSINITIPKNRLIAFPNLSTSSYSSTLILNESINVQQLYKFGGVDPKTGIYQFVDKDGKLTSTPGNNNENKIVLSNPDPKLYGGFQNSLTYKSIQIDFLFQFVKQVGGNYFFGDNPGAKNKNQPTNILNRWQEADNITDIQKYNTYILNPLSDYLIKAKSSDRAFSDASYIRLKNVSVSWQIPQSWKNKIKMQDVRLIAQAQNILTWTKYPGLDPENRSVTSLPPLRIITLGVNASL